MPSTGWAVTVNVGGGPGNTTRREQAMTDWAAHAAKTRAPAFVFAQEVSADAWLGGPTTPRTSVSIEAGESGRRCSRGGTSPSGICRPAGRRT